MWPIRSMAKRLSEMIIMDTFYWNDELYHHGILGMRHGIRRFQNPDGSLTEEGRRRYLKGDDRLSHKGQKKLVKEYSKYYLFDKTIGTKHRTAVGSFVKQLAEQQPAYKKAYGKYAKSYDYTKIVVNRSNKQDKLDREVTKVVKNLLGAPGKKLMYKDEKDSVIYKNLVENELIPAIIAKELRYSDK